MEGVKGVWGVCGGGGGGKRERGAYTVLQCTT